MPRSGVKVKPTQHMGVYSEQVMRKSAKREKRAERAFALLLPWVSEAELDGYGLGGQTSASTDDESLDGAHFAVLRFSLRDRQVHHRKRP